MKTTITPSEPIISKRGFGIRLLFYVFLLSIIGLSKAFAQCSSGLAASFMTYNNAWSFCAGDSIQFVNLSSTNPNGGGVAGAIWTFDDGSPADNNYDAIHVYTNPSVYSITLISSDTAGCTDTIVAQITITSPDDASFVYISTTYCQLALNQTPIVTGTPGGTFSATPAGLVINPSTGTINLSTSAAGVYTVSYVTNGSCPNSSSLLITVTTNCPSGASITSPLNGATINNRCDLQFCAYDSIGTAGNYTITSDFSTSMYAWGNNNGIGAFCLSAYPYYDSIPTGVHTFYLNNSSVWPNMVVDSITLTIANTIHSLDSDIIFTQTPSTNGNYDFSVNGLSASETYTLIFQDYTSNFIDTITIFNTTTTTYTHQYPYDGNFDGGIQIIADCDGAVAYDSIMINVTNTGCSAATLPYSYGQMIYNSYCSDSVYIEGYVSYAGLSANGNSSLIVNWGDGSTDTYTIAHNGNTDSLFIFHLSYAHYYYPGVYTALITLYDTGACHMDTLIQSVTISSATCANLTGTIYGDANGNCTLDIGEDGIANIPVIITMGSDTYWAWTDYQGNYAFNFLPAGTYTIQTGLIYSGYTITCSNSSVTITSGTTTSNFGVSCGNGFDVAINNIWLEYAVFPGDANPTAVETRISGNACNAIAIPGQVKLVLNGCTQLSGSYTYPPDVIIPASTGDTLVWNTSDLNNFVSWPAWQYGVDLTTCTGAQLGDTLCLTAIVIPGIAGDIDLSNNTFTRCFEVGASYDPNNKEVMPAGTGAQGFIAATTPELTYTINFQNTGSAPAHNIYVLDTLDTDLDINSIEILSASHRMQVYSLPNRVIKFMFDNILLPDSTSDEKNSHGYVTFKIKLNTGLTPGTTMENTGYIYFDYNEPVVTNTELNTIETPSGIREIKNTVELKVYPNPAKDKLIVYTNRNNTFSTIVITDVLGKTIKTIKTNEPNTELNVTDLQSGVYFIKVTQGNNTNTQKVIISK